MFYGRGLQAGDSATALVTDDPDAALVNAVLPFIDVEIRARMHFELCKTRKHSFAHRTH